MITGLKEKENYTSDELTLIYNQNEFEGIITLMMMKNWKLYGFLLSGWIQKVRTMRNPQILNQILLFPFTSVEIINKIMDEIGISIFFTYILRKRFFDLL
jgi:hypothetical protein